MSNHLRERLPDQVEKLLGTIAQLAPDSYEFTPDFLRRLGFSTPEAVQRAMDCMAQHAHEHHWDYPTVRVENERLFCGPCNADCWNSYQHYLQNA